MDKLQTILFVAPVLLFSFVAHEYAHGYAALKQGDPTALNAGRLTWNPIKHIDLWFTIILPAVLYWTMGMFLGGPKPIPVDPRNYKSYRSGDIIVSLAGVATNLVLAFVFTLLVIALGFLARWIPAAEPSMGILQYMFVLGVQLNLILVVFNLLPIPPLDGSHVVKHLLPAKLAMHYQRLGLVGLIAIIVMIQVAPGGLRWWFSPAFYLFGVLRGGFDQLLTPTYMSFAS